MKVFSVQKIKSLLVVLLLSASITAFSQQYYFVDAPAIKKPRVVYATQLLTNALVQNGNKIINGSNATLKNKKQHHKNSN